jgi:branched-chain amino acid transport system substrate-binding protein
MVSKIRAAKVDAIFAPNYTQELILIVQQARAIGFTGPLICGLDACPPFADLCGPEADGVLYINNILESDPDTQPIIKAYKDKRHVLPPTNFSSLRCLNFLAKVVGRWEILRGGGNAVETSTSMKGLPGSSPSIPRLIRPSAGNGHGRDQKRSAVS